MSIFEVFAYTFVSTAIIAFIACSAAAVVVGWASEQLCQGIDE